MNAFAVILLVAAIFALVAPIVYILCAKPGYENNTGFHEGRPPSVQRVEEGTAYICAWCDGNNDGAQWAMDRGLLDSHGICPACSEKFFPTHPYNVHPTHLPKRRQ